MRHRRKLVHALHVLALGGLAAIVVVLAPAQALAQSGPQAPITELGTTFHSGPKAASMTGSSSYFVTFRSEERKDRFRFFAAFDFSFSSGKAVLDDVKYASSLYGATFLPGVHLFIFKEGRFQPFVGGSPIIGFNILKLATPPSGVEANTQALAFGYEVGAGVDMRFGSTGGDAIRLRGSLWNETGSLAGTGFNLGGFRLALGFVF